LNVDSMYLDFITGVLEVTDIVFIEFVFVFFWQSFILIKKYVKLKNKNLLK